jgi:hypothetical protein
MIKTFKQFESVENLTEIMEDVKNEFNLEYINMYIINHFQDYCDDEEMEENGYEDPVKFYKEMGAGGNGIEYDLLDEMWNYVKEKYGIDLADKKYDDLTYDMNYYIKEHFPYFYFVDYRKKNDLTKNWDL